MSHIFDALNKNSDDDPKSKASREKMNPPSNEDEETTGEENRPEAPGSLPIESRVPAPTTPSPHKHEPYFQVSLEKSPANIPTSPQTQQRELVVPQRTWETDLLDNSYGGMVQELSELRESLETLLQRRGRRVIAFAGSVAGEGGTTIALHYAQLLAIVAEQRVLLVDGDMGRSRASLSRGLEKQDGLSELLRGDLPLEQVVLKSTIPNLHFLPAGRDQINHVEAARRGDPRRLFDRLNHYYDVLIIDCPAVLEYGESTPLSAASDGVVVVVKANVTRREVVQQTLAKLNRSRCRILGTVLNSYNEKIPGFINERI
jgi:protein-tyrosine kinase